MMTYQMTVGSAAVDLPQGRLAYRAAGPAVSSHPPVVFVHGILVDARLWEAVADRLAAAGIRSYAPTLPLGAHQWKMNEGADLSPVGVAQLLRDFIAAVGLTDVTLVGNDTGGAICQVLLGGDTSRVGAAVLTNCDALGTFPPRKFAPLFRALRHPGLVACLVPALRSERVGCLGRERPVLPRPARAAAERGVPERQPHHGAGRPGVPAVRSPR